MDPYKEKLIPGSLCSKKALVWGRLVAVMDAKVSHRGLRLMVSPTRALLSGQIHELMVTDEEDAAPGRTVNGIAYVCFFELERGGVVAKGDKVTLQGKAIGEIVGFDETHTPNHLNVVIKSSKRKSGKEMGVELGDRLIIG